MKILLIINKANRETLIMEAIKREILKIDSDAIVDIRQRFSPNFINFIFSFKPNAILMFPFTSLGIARWFYVLKFFRRVKIITMRAEGVIDFNNDYNILWATGFDKYGSSLVDYEVFWGEKVAKAIGEQLVLQKKLSSIERVKVFGYPRLEAYFEKRVKRRPALPSRIKYALDKYNKERVVFFITGFHLADYSKQNLFDAKDLDAENNLNELLEGVEISKRFRADWILGIMAAATENPDALFLVKKHPIEKSERYKKFEGINNIVFIYEDIQVDEVTPYVGILFHYGSTTLVDAYLSKIPSVYVYSENNKQWYSDLGWPSSDRVNVKNICVMVRSYFFGNISFVMKDEMKVILYEIFNIKEGLSYKPSKDIARLLLELDTPQKIKLTDFYFWESVVYIFIWQKIHGAMKRMKKLLLMVLPT